MDLNEYIRLGEQMGLKGSELASFIKEQQELARETKARLREEAKLEREAARELAEHKAKLDRETADHQAALARDAAEHEATLAREAAALSAAQRVHELELARIQAGAHNANSSVFT